MCVFFQIHADHDNHNMMMMMHESCNQEFSDWPNGLLAIGTFGNNTNPKHSEKIGELEQQEVERDLRLVMNEEHLLDCLCDDDDGGDGDGDRRLERQGSVVERGGKDILSEKRNRGIGKRSLTFLMKKALLCGAGFVAAPPIIRDPLPDPKLDRSTMEKVTTQKHFVNKKNYLCMKY